MSARMDKMQKPATNPSARRIATARNLAPLAVWLALWILPVPSGLTTAA